MRCWVSNILEADLSLARPTFDQLESTIHDPLLYGTPCTAYGIVPHVHKHAQAYYVYVHQYISFALSAVSL
jgi:hypothetical protein